MLTVSNVMLMSGSLCWFVLVKTCCNGGGAVVAFVTVLCGILFVMYGSSVLSRVFGITERSDRDGSV